MPTKTYDPEKLTPEQNAVIESILKIAEAEVPSEPERKYCIWKPTKGDHYFYYDSTGVVRTGQWDDDWTDNAKYDHDNCYRIKEEAFFAAERCKVVAELRRFAEEYSDTVDWEDHYAPKFIIVYCYDTCALSVEQVFSVRTSDVYFSNKEIAKTAILTIGEDRLKKYYFGSYKEQE